MLPITIPAREATELWDEQNETFIPVPAMKEQKLQLEHSLIALSKWESKWCKPFFDSKELTPEETIDYIKCMTINSNVDQRAYKYIDQLTMKKIMNYVYAPMTASSVPDEKGKNTGERITSELIYYWMVACGIPFECEKWHLNRLIMLIRICNFKNRDPKKMSANELRSKYASINAARRKKYGKH